MKTKFTIQRSFVNTTTMIIFSNRNRYKRKHLLKNYILKKGKFISIIYYVSKDIIYDFKNKKFSNVKNGKNNIDILRYRFNQFIGTYSGYKKNI